MAAMLSDSIFPQDYDNGTPEHLIIWQDDHIADPEKYHMLKNSFSSNTDPRNQTWTMLTDPDHYNLLRNDEVQSVRFGDVPVLLLAFNDPKACYAALEKYRDRRILFITSGSLGKDTVPIIIRDFQQVFTDPVTNDSYHSIYIFCGDVLTHSMWAIEYRDYVHIFGHEADLLARITHDMAEYYFTQGERQRAKKQLKKALRLYQWSKKLFLRYQKMGQFCQENINRIDRITNDIENILRPTNDDNEDGKGCEPCS